MLSVVFACDLLKDPDIFIGDTGATCNSTNSDIGLVDVRQAKMTDNIIDASRNDILGSIVGDMPSTVCDKNGQELQDVMIKDIVHLPQSGYNLFSLTKRLEDGWTLGGNANAIWITKGKLKVTFDIKIKTPKGAIFAIYLKRKVNDDKEVAAVMPDKNKSISTTVAHGLTGHINETDSKKIVKHLGYKVSRGSAPKCEPCAQSKAKQKSLPSRITVIKKVVQPKAIAATVNEHIHLDISTIKAPAKLNIKVIRPNWRLMMDERTGMKWSDFFSAKNDMVEPTCVKLNRWKEGGKPVKYIRLDNAGENIALKKRSESAEWKLNIEFEFTARDTPQQNSLVEVGFATIGNRGRAMMIAANVPERTKYKLFREAFTCATMLDWLMLITLDDVTKTRVEHWNGELPRWSQALRTWGEAGVVKTKTKTTPKMNQRGITCMMVGYAVNHSDGVYRMWNPSSNRIIISRDVTWLKRMYYQPEKMEQEILVNNDDDDNEVRESQGNDLARTSDDDISTENNEVKNENVPRF